MRIISTLIRKIKYTFQYKDIKDNSHDEVKNLHDLAKKEAIVDMAEEGLPISILEYDNIFRNNKYCYG
jgi:hypothetical protein